MESRSGKWYAAVAFLTGASMLIGGCANPKKESVNPSLLPNPQIEPSPTPDYCGPGFVQTTIVKSGDTFGEIINPEGKNDMSIYDGKAAIGIGQNNNATIATGANALPFAVANGYFDTVHPGDAVIYGYNLDVLNCLEEWKWIPFENWVLLSGSETDVTVVDHGIRETYTLINGSEPELLFRPENWIQVNQ